MVKNSSDCQAAKNRERWIRISWMLDPIFRRSDNRLFQVLALDQRLPNIFSISLKKKPGSASCCDGMPSIMILFDKSISGIGILTFGCGIMRPPSLARSCRLGSS